MIIKRIQGETPSGPHPPWELSNDFWKNFLFLLDKRKNKDLIFNFFTYLTLQSQFISDSVNLRHQMDANLDVSSLDDSSESLLCNPGL